jgi:hypothetical protein
MSAHLARLRDDIRIILNVYMTPTTIDDQMLDAALRQALTDSAQYMPLITQTITLVEEGKTQVIGAMIPDIAKVIDLRYPWDPAYPENQGYPYNQISNNVVIFKNCNPAIGDTVLIIGRPLYRLAGVNGTTDTLPETYDATIVAFAAANLLRREHYRRAMQPTDNSEKPRTKTTLNDIANTIENEATTRLLALTPHGPNPVWRERSST